MKISIVIPNYNGEGILEKNLHKVINSLVVFGGDGEIIVVDDASVDDSLKVLAKIKNSSKIPLRILKNSVNVGFSSTVNKGVRDAKGDFIVLLNTDVNPHENFLDSLIANFRDENVFGVGCLDESIEDGKIVPRGRGVGKWSKGFLSHSAGALDKKSTLWVSGGSSGYRKSIWDLLGGLDETYNPFYWEDIDLSYRALKSGYKVVFEKESKVIHEHEKGAIKRKYSASDVKKIAYRNQFIFVWKNADFSNLISHFAWLPYHLFNATIHLDREFIIGFFKAIAKISQIKRSETQKLFVKTDSDVIELASE